MRARVNAAKLHSLPLEGAGFRGNRWRLNSESNKAFPLRVRVSGGNRWSLRQQHRPSRQARQVSAELTDEVDRSKDVNKTPHPPLKRSQSKCLPLEGKVSAKLTDEVDRNIDIRSNTSSTAKAVPLPLKGKAFS